MLLLFRRRDSLNPRILAVALFAAAAAVIPFVPDMETVQRVRSQYLDRNVPWEPIEALLFGRVSPFSIGRLEGAREPGAIVAGALLSPVATARTALRLWGDVFLEPIGSILALAAIIAIATGHAGRSARIPAGLLLVGILPGFTSSYDRPSLIRMIGLPIAVPVLSAIAFGRFAGTRGTRAWVAAVATGTLVTCSGIALFARVNPRLLAQSWVTVALDACQSSRCVFLDFKSPRPVPWLRIESMAAAVPPRPIPVIGFDGDLSPTFDRDAANGSVWIWSQALEVDARVSAAIAARWSHPRFFELRDPAGNRVAIAASLRNNWQPELPPDRWQRIAAVTSSAR